MATTRRPKEIESSKFNTKFPTTSTDKDPMIFGTFGCTLRKSTLKLDIGSQKWPKSVLLRENE